MLPIVFWINLWVFFSWVIFTIWYWWLWRCGWFHRFHARFRLGTDCWHLAEHRRFIILLIIWTLLVFILLIIIFLVSLILLIFHHGSNWITKVLRYSLLNWMNSQNFLTAWFSGWYFRYINPITKASSYFCYLTSIKNCVIELVLNGSCSFWSSLILLQEGLQWFFFWTFSIEWNGTIYYIIIYNRPSVITQQQWSVHETNTWHSTNWLPLVAYHVVAFNWI